MGACGDAGITFFVVFGSRPTCRPLCVATAVIPGKRKPPRLKWNGAPILARDPGPRVECGSHRLLVSSSGLSRGPISPRTFCNVWMVVMVLSMPVGLTQPPGRARWSRQRPEGQRIAERLRSEARWSQQAWALWEALNGGATDSRKGFREALHHLGLGGQVGFLQGVLLRDALLALFRISDQEGKDRLTLCAIARLLKDDELRKTLR